MKKRLILISVGLGSVILIICLIFIITYISKTIAGEDVRKYCLDNTSINATSFVRCDLSSESLYAFWVAEKSASDMQELFIFRRAQTGFIDFPKRYSFIHTSSSMEESIGSVMFMPRDENNKKKSSNLLLFYSSNNHRITTYTFTLKENGKTTVRKGGVASDEPFIVFLPNLGKEDGMDRTFIKAEFFDYDGKLVEIKAHSSGTSSPAK